jgi:hypothetical protein
VDDGKLCLDGAHLFGKVSRISSVLVIDPEEKPSSKSCL